MAFRRLLDTYSSETKTIVSDLMYSYYTDINTKIMAMV